MIAENDMPKCHNTLFLLDMIRSFDDVLTANLQSDVVFFKDIRIMIFKNYYDFIILKNNKNRKYKKSNWMSSPVDVIVSTKTC